MVMMGRAGCGRDSGRVIAAIGAALALAGVAWGQAADPSLNEATAAAEERVSQNIAEILSPDPKWTVQVEASAWYVAPSGDVKLPASSGTGGSGSAEGDSVAMERLNLDSTRLMPTGEVHMSGGRWRGTFSGAAYTIDREGSIADSAFRIGSVDVVAGDPLDVSFDLTTVELSAGYRVWGRVFSAEELTQKPENAIETLARVYVIGGARFYDVGFAFARATADRATAEADQFFGEPIIGARVEVEVARDFTMDFQLSGGGLPLGDKTSYSVDIQAGFMWRPNPHIGIQIGYRQLAYWLSDGEDEDAFEYDGRLAGLFAGVVLRF
jgi:hypothetical protein